MMEPAKPNKKNLNMTNYKEKGFGNEQMSADPKFVIKDDDSNDMPEEVAGTQDMAIAKKSGSLDTNKEEEMAEMGRGMGVDASGAEGGVSSMSVEEMAGNKGDTGSLKTTGTFGEEKAIKKASD